MAKKDLKKEEVINSVIEFEPIPENSVVTIIFFANGRDAKEDIEKEVSGNIANILIKKGFAKLKN